MAIQFHNSAILFDGTSIAMAPACCCGPCSLCDSLLPDSWLIDLSNYSSLANGWGCSSCCSAISTSFIVGNRQLSNTDYCNYSWSDHFFLLSGNCEEYWGGIIPPGIDDCDSSGYCLLLILSVHYVQYRSNLPHRGLFVRVRPYTCNTYGWGCGYDRSSGFDEWWIDHDNTCLSDHGDEITLSTNLEAENTPVGSINYCCTNSGGSYPGSITLTKS